MDKNEPINESSKDDILTPVDTNSWEEIGFQRSLGGFFYNLVILLFSSIITIFTIALLTDLFYPFPEIQGYNSIAGGFFFAIIYKVFDMGTAYGIQRFIAEYRIKDPKKMVEYIQFFIWYQMFTGILQVSVISYVVFVIIIPNSQYIHLSWLFLIICQKQWPGMLGTFKAVLEGMQLYNKTNVLNLINNQVFQTISNIVFILLGRWWGQNNPAIGDLMGATIGVAVGSYIDDFFAMMLSQYYLGKVVKPLGISKRDLWRRDFSSEVAKKCIKLGAQMSVGPIVNTVSGILMMMMYLNAMPQYATFITLAALAGGIVGIVYVGGFNTTPLIAESYMNQKKELAGFYVTTSIRWNGFFMWMLAAILIAFIPMVITVILALPELENYVYAQAFLIPMLIHTLFKPYIDFPNGILLGTENVSFYAFVRVFEEFMQVFFIWFFLYGIKLQEKTILGMDGVVFILAFEHFFPRLIKMFMCWIYINKVLLHIKINWWQTLIGPLICSVFVFGVGQLWKVTIFDPLILVIGVLPSAAITLVFGLILIPLVVYLPLTGIMGCWDDFGMKTFKKAIDLSGPSKKLVNLFYKSTSFGVKHSKIHNKFKIPWETAVKQIDELMEIKKNVEMELLKK